MIEDAIRNAKPGPIRTYSLRIPGMRWRIMQVVGAALGLGGVEFITTDAYRILRRLGYTIDVQRSTLSESSRLSTPERPTPRSSKPPASSTHQGSPAEGDVTHL